MSNNVVFFPENGGGGTVFNNAPPVIRTVSGGSDSVALAGVPMNPYGAIPQIPESAPMGMEQLPAPEPVATTPQLPPVAPAVSNLARVGWSWANTYAQKLPWYVWFGAGMGVAYYYKGGNRRPVFRSFPTP